MSNQVTVSPTVTENLTVDSLLTKMVKNNQRMVFAKINYGGSEIVAITQFGMVSLTSGASWMWTGSYRGNSLQVIEVYPVGTEIKVLIKE